MDINNAASARAAYYDRGADVSTIEYETVAVAPHGPIIRDTYTVPDNRKAIISSMTLFTQRVTAPGVGSRYAVKIRYTPFGGVAEKIAICRDIATVVGENLHIELSPSFVMYPGDEIDIMTEDYSTGGTVGYISYVLISEFDF